MASCTLTGTIVDPSGTAISNVTVKFNVTLALQDPAGNLLVPKEISVTTNASGVFTMTISQSIYGVLAIEYPPNSIESNKRIAYSVTIPGSSSATFPGIVVEF